MKYILLLLSIIIISCSSIKDKSSIKTSKNIKKTKTVQQTDTTNKSEMPQNRFSDTTVIRIESYYSSNNEAMLDIFSQTVNDFDKEKYKESCEKFESLSETIIVGDSLYYESMYFRSECTILKNDFSDAENILLELLNDDNTPIVVRERCLVRIGQVYCVLKKEELAEKYFSLLKLEFPKSIYLPLANCKTIK